MSLCYSPTALRFLLLFSLLHLVNSQVQYVIKNNCPSTITVFTTGGLSLGPLAHGASVTKNLAIDAVFYTNANGGTSTGAGSTKAGFFGEQFYYYIVRDPSHFNTGLSITPRHAASNGFCVAAGCDSEFCMTAFTVSPTAGSFPAPVCAPAPAPPVYSCPFGGVIYDILFCPSGSFPGPPPTSQLIHPDFNPNKCLDVRGAVFANGTPVQIYDCNGTGAQNWVINKAGTRVQVAGRNFCLDAGSTPGNGVGMKIWECFNNLPAQEWDYTNDDRIVLQGKGLCLDLTDGVLDNSNVMQTWTCINFNTNQIWTQ